jgi:D-alanyl-D-alanine carboxypeptidase
MGSMQRKQLLICILGFFLCILLLPQNSYARINQHVNARSAILIDMENGNVLCEQDADSLIPPASITKILSLYLVFEAIKEGQVHLTDMVEVSKRAASMPPSRMGLRAGTRVPLEELIKGMAVVSGNDACVAAAEHISGNVERFVSKMNAKARELGMTNSRFMTPNGLPAPGQLTTARDIAKLSIAYLRRFPESLTIHSMQAYSYGRNSHHNANRLLGKCPGVDGLKTGFVCASGYNISATAKRGGVRILAVVMGARSPWVRLSETQKLIEAGFRECGSPYSDVKCAVNLEPSRDTQTVIHSGKESRRGLAYARSHRKSKAQSAGTVTSKKTISRKVSVKEKTHLAKSSAGKKINSVTSASKKTRAGHGIAGKQSEKAKSDHAGSGKASKVAKAEKSHKAGKKGTETASLKKKSPVLKHSPHAQVSKKKAEG